VSGAAWRNRGVRRTCETKYTEASGLDNFERRLSPALSFNGASRVGDYLRIALTGAASELAFKAIIIDFRT